MVVSVDANVHSASLFAIDFQRSMALSSAQEKCVESFVECVFMSKQSLIFIYQSYMMTHTVNKVSIKMTHCKKNINILIHLYQSSITIKVL